MIAKYGVVYVTQYGQKYHLKYHYSERNLAISMLTASERMIERCTVCQSPPLADFIIEKGKLSWFIKHWFIAIIIFTFVYIYLIYKLNRITSFK